MILAIIAAVLAILGLVGSGHPVAAVIVLVVSGVAIVLYIIFGRRKE